MSEETIVAICALVVATVSTALAAWTAFIQRRHMQLSVRPIAAVPVANYENRIGVFLKNTGLGPMRVVSLRATSDEGKIQDSLISHMPPLRPNIMWSTYYGTADGLALEPGSMVDLLLLEGKFDDPDFRGSRDSVRAALSKITLVVEYEDLYGRRMRPYNRDLSWFA